MAELEHQLMALSPIDGRYADRAEPLRPHLSEFGLIRARLEVMAGWVGMLGSGVLPDRPPLSDVGMQHLLDLGDGFSVQDATEIKAIEKTTNHDVKAVEIWLQGKLADPAFDDYREMVHFGSTSEDVNSAAYALMLGRATHHVMLPTIDEIVDNLGDKSAEWAHIPMLAMTHGQPATPTTLGKEMAVFYRRLHEQQDNIERVEPLAKYSGATGNYAAMHEAFPEVNWPEVSRGFLTKLGVTQAPITTQIEPHDWMARLSNEVSTANTIVLDLARDMWLYISRGVLKQRVKADEVGSSTMPHKVNPIDFENGEANLGLSTALLRYLADNLPVSRLQRDLSDSSRLRAFGETFGHGLVAYKSVLKGLGKVDPNEAKLAAELDDNWAVLAEPLQTIMRRYGIPNAYDRIKKVTRGEEMDKVGYYKLVARLATELPAEAVERLLELTPATYTGYSEELATGASD